MSCNVHGGKFYATLKFNILQDPMVTSVQKEIITNLLLFLEMRVLTKA